MTDRFEIGDDRVRFVLGQRWSPAPMIGMLGMNPSKASAEVTDPTWSTFAKFAKRWGFGGQIFMNPVPMRSSDPDEAIAMLREVANGKDPWAVEQIADNLLHCLDQARVPVAWVVGWGDKGAAMNNVFRCHRKTLDALYAGGARTFLAVGMTAAGNPKHILARGRARVPDDVALREWQPNWRAQGPKVDVAALIRGAA